MRLLTPPCSPHQPFSVLFVANTLFQYYALGITRERFHVGNMEDMRMRWLQRVTLKTFRNTTDVKENPKVVVVIKGQISSTIMFLHQPHHSTRVKLISRFFHLVLGEKRRGKEGKKWKSEDLNYCINTAASPESTSEKVLFLHDLLSGRSTVIYEIHLY